MSFTYDPVTGYDRHIPPPRKHDKRKTRPFLYSPPEDRAPKHHNLFDTAGELEPVQSNVGFVEPGLRSHPPLAYRDLAGIQWLFDQVALGDKVVIYWS